jgi:predicted DNA-binding protein (MmcQ/YjbR family)
MGAPMNVDFVRGCCRSFPHVTETVQWEDDLVFKVGGKMFAVMPLEPAPVRLSFKCSPEDFAELTERPGIVPAPYLARAHWVSLESEYALPAAELKQRLRDAYALVYAKLPKKTRDGLA